MTERLIAIGDIHGCLLALESLIEAIQPTRQDLLVTLGDYVDRGPNSRGVVDFLIDLSTRTRLVKILGNHEEMMLNVLRNGESHHNWLRYGGIQTLDSYQFDGDLDFLPQSHVQFFDELGDYFEYDEFLFTHAAYDPSQPLGETDPQMLRWYHLTEGIPSAHQSGKTVVVGHTAQREGEVLDLGHLLCIDTFCYGGGWLTAIDLHTRELWQTSKDGELRSQ